MSESFGSRLAHFARANPSALVVLVSFAHAGAVAGSLLSFGESIAAWKRILGGAICGLYFGLFPLGKRLFD